MSIALWFFSKEYCLLKISEEILEHGTKLLDERGFPSRLLTPTIPSSHFRLQLVSLIIIMMIINNLTIITKWWWGPPATLAEALTSSSQHLAPLFDFPCIASSLLPTMILSLKYWYQIFVILFTRARSPETKNYTQKYVNQDKTEYHKSCLLA